MSQNTQNSCHGFQLSFTKGMTLQQYMAGLTFNNPQSTTQSEDKSEQNFYESTLNASLKDPLHFNRKCSMQNIDQQCQEQLKDSIETDTKKWELPEQLTKATFREGGETIQKRESVDMTKKMNSTAYFGNASNEKGFRVKNVSNSPAKKSKESSSPATSMTLYGMKFNYSKQKQSKKMSELITFYGKTPRLDTKEDKKVEGRSSFKNMKKKNPTDLHSLLELETKTKNKLTHKIGLPDIRIEGLRDKLIQRKNKFC